MNRKSRMLSKIMNFNKLLILARRPSKQLIRITRVVTRLGRRVRYLERPRKQLPRLTVVMVNINTQTYLTNPVSLDLIRRAILPPMPQRRAPTTSLRAHYHTVLQNQADFSPILHKLNHNHRRWLRQQVGVHCLEAHPGRVIEAILSTELLMINLMSFRKLLHRRIRRLGEGTVLRDSKVG